MATYLRLSSKNIQILDPSSFRLAKAGVHVFTTFVSHLLDKKLGLLKLDLHIQRIINGARVLGINTDLNHKDYLSWFEENLKKIILSDYKKNNCRQKIRIILRSSEEIEIFIEPYVNSWGDTIKLKSFIASRHLADIKHTDFEVSTLARTNAEEHGAQEAILIDDDASVLEGAWSNVFWFDQNNQLCTNESKVLPGITRQILIEMSDVKFSRISITDLKNCSEVFITQSTSGITAVNQIDDKEINSNKKTIELKASYQQYLKTNLLELAC